MTNFHAQYLKTTFAQRFLARIKAFVALLGEIIYSSDEARILAISKVRIWGRLLARLGFPCTHNKGSNPRKMCATRKISRWQKLGRQNKREVCARIRLAKSEFVRGLVGAVAAGVCLRPWGVRQDRKCTCPKLQPGCYATANISGLANWRQRAPTHGGARAAPSIAPAANPSAPTCDCPLVHYLYFCFFVFRSRPWICLIMPRSRARW